eukprot:scaffold63139_cov16-Tisochrysis_lutea.AAC.1
MASLTALSILCFELQVLVLVECQVPGSGVFGVPTAAEAMSRVPTPAGNRLCMESHGCASWCVIRGCTSKQSTSRTDHLQ